MDYFNRLGKELLEGLKIYQAVIIHIYKTDVILFTGGLLFLVSILILFFGMIPILLSPTQTIEDLNVKSSQMTMIMIIVSIPIILGVIILFIGKNKEKGHRVQSTIEKSSIKKPPIKIENLEEQNPISKQDQVLIVKKLTEKNCFVACPICANENLVLMPHYGMSKNFYKDKIFIQVKSGIPTIRVICSNCGFLMEHAVVPLGMGDLGKKEEKEFQNNKKSETGDIS